MRGSFAEHLDRQNLTRRPTPPRTREAKSAVASSRAVLGYYQYHAIPGNTDRLGVFQHRLRRLWRNILFRRSQKGRKSWKRLSRLLDR